MCRKCCKILTAVLTLMIMTGCTLQTRLGDEETGIYQKIHRKFNQMTAYTATVRLTVKSNKTEQVYEMQQSVKPPSLARTEILQPSDISGLVTVFFEGNVQLQQNGETPLTVPAQAALQDVFVHDFFARYYQSEETALSVSAGKKGTVLLETTAQPESSKRYKITMLLDAARLEPLMITVYDIGGNIRVQTEFLEFCYNPELDDALFNIREKE